MLLPQIRRILPGYWRHQSTGTPVLCVTLPLIWLIFSDGRSQDIGIGKGKNHSVNFPLRDGITDEAYKSVFEPVRLVNTRENKPNTNMCIQPAQVISQIMEWYRPSAVVLQCGGDSLSGDRIGTLNLSMRGHANCVQFIKSFGLPLLILGGGGYTIRNVSRTWAFETGLAAGQELGSGE